MKNVLSMYRRPYDPKRLMVGMNEQPKQLIAETRQPLLERSTITREAAAWERRYNQKIRTIDWRFTTADARIKLKHL